MFGRKDFLVVIVIEIVLGQTSKKILFAAKAIVAAP